MAISRTYTINGFNITVSAQGECRQSCQRAGDLRDRFVYATFSFISCTGDVTDCRFGSIDSGPHPGSKPDALGESDAGAGRSFSSGACQSPGNHHRALQHIPAGYLAKRNRDALHGLRFIPKGLFLSEQRLSDLAGWLSYIGSRTSMQVESPMSPAGEGGKQRFQERYSW